MQAATGESEKVRLRAIVSEQSPHLFAKAAERFMDGRAHLRWRCARALCRAFDSQNQDDVTAVYRIYTTAAEQAIMWARQDPRRLNFPATWEVILDVWARPWAVTYFGRARDRGRHRQDRLRNKRQALAAARGVPPSLAALEAAVSQFQQLAAIRPGSALLADMGGPHEQTQDTSVAQMRRELRELRQAQATCGQSAVSARCADICSHAHQCRKGLAPLA